MRLTREILHGTALQRYREKDEFPPDTVRWDAEYLEFARNRGGTAWHLMGTCRMGLVHRTDSVVGPNLRVIGLEGLRVADASIMPTMPSGNTQIPTMMIAEKAADLILGK